MVNPEEFLLVVIWYCAWLSFTVLLCLNHNDIRILDLLEPLLYLPSWCIATKRTICLIQLFGLCSLCNWFSLDLGNSNCTLPFHLSTGTQVMKKNLFCNFPAYLAFYLICFVVAESVPLLQCATFFFFFTTRCHLMAWLTEVSLENTEMVWTQCSRGDGLLSSF